MHLETIQHLRSLAGRHDDLVPIAKPLLLDLLDSYERQQDQRRLRYQPHWSVREMDAIDELSRLKDLEPVAIVRQALRHYQLAHADLKNPAAMPADVLTANEEIIAQLEASLGTIAEAAHMIIGAYDPRYFRAGAWAQAALQACQEQFPCKAVNEVTPVNPVTSPQPETFESHGHTWTRHTPGDPRPVPKDTEVIVLLRRELHQIPGGSEVRKAGEYAWCQIGDGRHSAEIIGWRYAEPQPSTPAK